MHPRARGAVPEPRSDTGARTRSLGQVDFPNMSGCATSRPVYFEIGANNGAWMSQMLLRHARGRTSTSLSVPRSFVVEPNPRHAAELELLVQRYRTHYERAAAWSSDGQMTFHFRGNDEARSSTRSLQKPVKRVVVAVAVADAVVAPDPLRNMSKEKAGITPAFFHLNRGLMPVGGSVRPQLHECSSLVAGHT